MYAHGAVAAKYLGIEAFHGVISEGWREAPVSRELGASLVFLERMTLEPLELGVSDVARAVEAGLERIDLEHAAMVGCMFNSMNRLVDAFGADLTEEQSGKLGGMLDVVDRVTAKSSKTKDPPLGPDLPAWVGKILKPIRESEGDSPVELRRAIEGRVSAAAGASRPLMEQELPPDLAAFVDRIEDDVWALTDEHFEELKQEWSEEAIYEFVHTASMASGIGRLEVAWSAICEAFGP